MLYLSDITHLLSQWQERMGSSNIEQSYKDALSDCIYDLRSVMDKNFEEEAIAHESFVQKLKEDEQQWNDYFNNLLADGMFA